MAYLNKIMLIGNVGADPQSRTYGDRKYVSFTLATTKRYTNRSGEVVDTTTWHNVEVSGPSADAAENLIRKGACLYVEGELNIAQYTDADGVQKKAVKVQNASFQLLDKREQSDQARAPQLARPLQYQQPARPQYQQPARPQPAQDPNGYFGTNPDDLPF